MTLNPKPRRTPRLASPSAPSSWASARPSSAPPALPGALPAGPPLSYGSLLAPRRTGAARSASRPCHSSAVNPNTTELNSHTRYKSNHAAMCDHPEPARCLQGAADGRDQPLQSSTCFVEPGPGLPQARRRASALGTSRFWRDMGRAVSAFVTGTYGNWGLTVKASRGLYQETGAKCSGGNGLRTRRRPQAPL